MIIGLSGRLGSGKTLGTTFLMALFKEYTGATIVSNYHTDITDIQVSNPVELNKVSQNNEGIQGLDEVWSWADSRNSGRNEVMTDLIINSRKRGWVVIYNSQKFHMVDKRLRDNTDFYGVCEHASGVDSDMAKIQLLDKDMQPAKTFRYNPAPFYSMYDTREEISKKSESEMYQEYMEEAIEKVENGEFDYKKELVSYLYMNKEIPKTRCEMIATEVFRRAEQ